jgi:hypothetical protein
MSHRVDPYPNGLPGYDEWKTTDPRDLEPEEPRVEQDPDDARDEAIEREYLDRQFGSLED